MTSCGCPEDHYTIATKNLETPAVTILVVKEAMGSMDKDFPHGVLVPPAALVKELVKFGSTVSVVITAENTYS